MLKYDTHNGLYDHHNVLFLQKYNYRHSHKQSLSLCAQLHATRERGIVSLCPYKAAYIL